MGPCIDNDYFDVESSLMDPVIQYIHSLEVIKSPAMKLEKVSRRGGIRLYV